MENRKTIYLIKYFLFFLFFIGIIFLYQKHNSGVDWTISEWLINYQGGFTRRGFLGEISYRLSNLFYINIRDTILIIQIIFLGTYYFYLFKYLKKILIDKILVFAIFSPIFLIYPIAEVEVLGRKEIFLFISFVITLFLFDIKKRDKFAYFYLSVLMFINLLIWEGIVFYFLFFLLIVVSSNLALFKKFDIRNIFLVFLPFFLGVILIINFKLDSKQISQMCQSINECYGAMSYLGNSLESNIDEVLLQFKISYLLRYIIIFFLGFFPFIIIILNSKTNNDLIVYKIHPLLIFLFALFPTFIFFIIAKDWGRWINISYSLSLLYLLFCLKNKLIITNYNLNKYKFFRNKSLIIFVFIIFSFTWNPKTLMNEDVGSIPIYRKIVKVVEIFLNK